jgi:hypothetical protein
MIDLSKEQVLTMAEAAKLKFLPRRRRGKKPHSATLYRWADSGFRGVRLEVIRIGNTICTSVEALQRFFDRLTAVKSAGVPPSQDRPAAGADDTVVDQRLDELGF